MEAPPPRVMLERIRALPTAGPLLESLNGAAGVFLVGGAVRDLLLGGAPLDIDVVVEGDALELARRLGGEIRAYGRFGTCTVSLGGRTYDLAGARRERYPQPGALPEVEPARLDEDLRRRDFTVNALAVALTGAGAGELHAPAGGLDDLEARVLRVFHDRSFLDDPTRLLRLARYASRLGFAPAAETDRLAREAVAAGALATVSGERVGAELRLLAVEPDPLGALGWLHRLGLDRAIHPGFGLEDRDLAERSLALLPAGDRRDRLVIALAARGIPGPELAPLLDRLTFPAPDRDAIVAAATGADAMAAALTAAGSPSEIAAAVGAAPAELVALAGALGPAKAARAWLDELRQVRLEITGDDLLAAGVPRGPQIGRGLRAALAARLDGRAPDRPAQLECALAAARGG